MKCDIIIPVWNQLEFTKDCIGHLIKNTKYPYGLILIDNKSEAKTKKYLEDIRDNKSLDVKLIRNEENIGFVKAVNQGLKASSAPYVCIMNNDTLPSPGWLERMVDFAESHRDVGLVNPQCNGHGDVPIETYAKSLEKHKGKYMEMNQCQGFCMLVKKEVINKIGYLDESFGIGGFDDTDYSMRAHRAGYRSVAISNAYVYHRSHASFDKTGDREDWVRKNQNIYYGKWGKHLRIGIIFSIDSFSSEAISRLMRFAYGLAMEWSWVHIWINFKGDENLIKASINKRLEENGLPRHQNIKIDYFNLPQFLFKIVIGAKLLERMRNRMRDKRFDAIIMPNDTVGFLSPFAKVADARTLSLSFNEENFDWLNKGRNVAISIKEERKKE